MSRGGIDAAAVGEKPADDFIAPTHPDHQTHIAAMNQNEA